VWSSVVLRSRWQCNALMLYMYAGAMCAYFLHIVGFRELQHSRVTVARVHALVVFFSER
jgi:hypothetical protein